MIRENKAYAKLEKGVKIREKVIATRLWMNNNFVVLVLSMVFLIAPSAICEEDIENRWIVSFSLYNGRPDPQIRLDQGEIEKIQNMIEVGLRKAVAVASDDPNPHQGVTLFYRDLGGKTSYKGTHIIVESRKDKRVLKLYPIAGRYLRIYSDDGNSSKLYKMINAGIEKYLVDLGIQKGAFNLKEQREILNSINQGSE
jgi:hypothetical protein